MLERHKLVWLSDEGWQAARADAAESTRNAIALWQHSGFPAVVRRAESDVGEGVVCAGIALPPDAQGRKQRIPLRVAHAHVRAASVPLPLEQVLPALPGHWQAALGLLVAEAGAQRISFRVYGSAALQVLIGMTYLTTDSDIDLLFQPASRAQLNTGLLLLARYARTIPLDGEILFPCGSAVAWKEWVAAIASPGNPRVLVKDMRRVRLASVNELLHKLEDEPCTSH